MFNKLNSSSLESVRRTGDTLTIKFTDGREMNYHKVPASVHLGLIQAPSAGRYFNQYIRGRYEDA